MLRRCDTTNGEIGNEAEAQFFDLSIDMLCILGFDGSFRRLNPAWETTLGFSRDELKAKPFIEFVHPEDRERTLHQNRGVRDGGRAWLFENRYLCKDGSFRWLLWNSTRDADRQVIYGIARDITERKQAEQERDSLLQSLQVALAEVRTLREILPICSYCKKIRDDQNYWQSVDSYILKHTNTRFTHGICPTCYAEVVRPQLMSDPARSVSDVQSCDDGK
jgi:PAS domain S-box-containing protein